jgi:hypothetical protein
LFHSGPKKPANKRTWAIQILTRDYLVAGQLQPRIDDVDEYFTELVSFLKQGTVHQDYPLPLLNAEVRPASNLAAPTRTYAQWSISLKNVIAFIPGDDDSRSALRQPFDNFKHPFPATLFAGCYQVQATLLSNYLVGWSELQSFLPLVDAQIDCLLPGAQLTRWQVPWLLLNGQVLQGDGRAPA